MTDKSDNRVGHLNSILDRGGGNLNDPIFKSSNARALPGKGGRGRDVEVSSSSAHYSPSPTQDEQIIHVPFTPFPSSLLSSPPKKGEESTVQSIFTNPCSRKN